MEAFSFTVTESAPHRLLVALRGELDLYSVEAFSAQVGEMLYPGALIVLDLRALWFADSSGLRAFLLLQRAADEQGARLCLSSVRPWLREVLERGNLTDAFDICRDAEEALERSAALSR